MSFLRTIIFLWIFITVYRFFYPPGFDDTDNMITHERSGLQVYIDHKTNLQYVGAGYFSGVTPRLNAEGKQMHVGE